MDPTSITLHTDPLVRRLKGVAAHGDTPFECDYISKVEGTLYQGGCEDGMVLPDNIVHVVSLYPWESYILHERVRSVLKFKMYDSSDTPDREEVLAIAHWINRVRATGPTLVHCQAGLNRSALVTVAALALDGWTIEKAIGWLREVRSPAVLCNRTFESWLKANFE